MLDFKLQKDKISGDEWIETSLTGKPLLTTPQLNKGTAFTQEERLVFGLIGKLPPQVESLEEQVKRAYQQYESYQSNLQKNIYLNTIHDINQVLFYKLVSQYITEVMPLIYTPIVGTAVKEFSREFRQPRGLYVAYPSRQYINEILDNRSNPDIDIIVVTDGEGVLGIGDQGVGAMDISIAKLMVYTLCGGIDPSRTLPVQLDVGTDNQKLLNDPFYLGWRHPRLRGDDYNQFVDDFVAAVKKKFPNVLLHWEDFGRSTAHRHLNHHRTSLCTFNDDIQGTGVVTLAALHSAIKANHSTLDEQRIIVFGAGTAGTGISDQIFAAMINAGMKAEEAHKHFWLIDRQGLLVDDMSDLTPEQIPYARRAAEVAALRTQNSTITLLDVIKQIKPTILIGTSTLGGAFTKEIVETMAAHTQRPIIFPLSNPTENSEANPTDLLAWTNGNVLIATGSPYDDVVFNNRFKRIAQSNNALAFPGIGLGVIAVKAKYISDAMLWAACEALSQQAPIRHDENAALLPSLEHAQEVAKAIAIAVANQAIAENLAQTLPKNKSIEKIIEELMWKPKYHRFVKTAVKNRDYFFSRFINCSAK